MVTCNPGPWLEGCLGALAEQDYPDLSVLVIDAASDADPTSRVAAALPTAFIRRLDSNPGYSAAANEVLGTVEGASHFLFLHDDAAPQPAAVRLMVEEAFRSNAGVVAPKIVDWDDPTILRAVGMGADRGGVVSAYGRGELDQEQHDAVRDVFVAPGGCTLVRADLFASLGGFDAGIAMLGEDLDLSWRAQIAGARVVVAPEATVRHLEATATGVRPLVHVPDDGPDPAPRLVARHRLRSLLKCYGRLHLLRVLPRVVLFSLLDAVIGLFAGRRRAVAIIFDAWRWNLRNLGELRVARKAVQRARVLPDGEVRRLQSRGAGRMTTFLRGGIAAEERVFGIGAAGRDMAGALRRGGLRLSLAVWLVVAIVLLAGSRGLVDGPLAAVGQMAPFPDSPLPFLRQFVSGWRITGLGSESPAPFAFALLGGAGTLLGGAMGLLQKVLVLGMLPLGVIGAHRLAAPLGSWRSRLVALALYAAIPLPYDALARGRWSGLVLYAAMPWLLSRLLRASGVAPFSADAPDEHPKPRPRLHEMEDEAGITSIDGPFVDPLEAEETRLAAAAFGGAVSHEEPVPETPPGPRGRVGGLWEQVVPAAVLLALAAAFAPAAAAVVLLTGLGLALGSLLLGEVRTGLRCLLVAAGAVAGAAVLLFPWTLELVLPGARWEGVLGLGPQPGRGPSLGTLLRLHTGGITDRSPAPALGWAFLVAAALPLVVGRDWRFRWATHMWTIALVSWGAAWAAGRGWLGIPPPLTDVLLTPAGIALVLATALGLVAFEVDLPGYRFGWRQLASLAAAVAAVAATLPVLGAALDGRWGMPDRDFNGLLSWMDDRRSEGAFRVLWVGDPEALPMEGWRLEGHLAYATSRNGPPDATVGWPASDDGSTALLADSLGVARRGETVRLGHLLAPMAVRYVVVPSRAAPSREDTPDLPLPEEIRSALGAQVDLRMIETDEALAVYENVAWGPGRAELPAAAVEASKLAGIEAARVAELGGAVAVLPRERSSTDFRGRLRDDQDVYLSEAASSGWQLSAGGDQAVRRKAFGWANAFSVDDGGEARLRFRTPVARYVALALQLLLWLGALRLLMLRIGRARSDRAPAP